MNSISKWIVLAATLLATAFGTYADDYNGPSVTMFYPGKVDPSTGASYQDLKDVTKAYVYFSTGSKIFWAKGKITQAGETVGTCIYKGNGNSPTPMMDPKDPDNADMMNLQPGLFTITIYGVSWKDADGEQVSWEDEDADIENVTYNRPGTSGSIIGQTGFEDGEMLSYYSIDSEKGVLKVYFSKALIQGRPKAVLSYGYGENQFETELEYTQSEDGLELIIDFRGKCLNPDVLAPNATFTDVDGTPLPNPTVIGLNLSDLYCVDGTTIVSTLGNTTISARASFQWRYVDLTLPNPKLTKAEFYNSSDPSSRFLKIYPNTDTMELFVENASSLESADISINVGTENATIADSDITKGEDSYIVGIPESLKSAAGSIITLSLVNFVMKAEDGVNHQIAPLILDENMPNEVFSIAELREKPVGSDIILVTGGVKITFSNADTLYTFGEDSSAAIEFRGDDENSTVFGQGELIKGRISGKYIAEGMFKVNKAESDLTTSDANIADGHPVFDLASVAAEENNCKLLTLMISDTMNFQKNDEKTMIVSDNEENFIAIPADHVDGFRWSDKPLDRITGVAYSTAGIPVLLIRDANDVVEDSSMSGVEDIAPCTNNDASLFDLCGRAVNIPDKKGIYIINGKKVVM